MNIAVIGPSYPFRGGIAHHTSLLAAHLSEQHDIRFIGFKRQYPEWLFPGTTDREADSAVPLHAMRAEPVIDSLNPLTWWRAARLVASCDPDIVLLPWWVWFWLPQWVTICALVHRWTAARIVIVCHNVRSHEDSWVSRWATARVLRCGDGFVVHSEEDKRQLLTLRPSARVVKTFHPTYDVFDTGAVTRESARAQLGVDGAVALFFGFVRPYKGLRYLLEAMPAVLAQRSVTLLVVGECWGRRETYEALIDRLGIGAAVRLIDRYVPNEAVATYFKAADVVVLPYVTGTGSGVAQLAFGTGRPVVATRVGCLPEVVEHGHTGLLVPPEDPHALAEALITCFSGDTAARLSAGVTSRNGSFSWSFLVRAVEEAAGCASHRPTAPAVGPAADPADACGSTDLSIVVASYNAQETIVDCVQALCGQHTSLRYEVIVVDSSTDRTPQLIQERFPTVRLIHRAQRTYPGVARTIGVGAARGAVIVFTDADCVAAPDWVSRISEAMRKEHEVVGGVVASRNGWNLVARGEYLLELSEFMPGRRAGAADFIPTSNIALSRAVLDRVGPLERWAKGSDTLLCARLRGLGIRPYFEPSIRVSHRNKGTWRRFLANQWALGYGAAEVRRRAGGRGAILVRHPVLACGLPMARTWFVLRRIWRSSPVRVTEFLVAYPVIACGLVAYTIGFLKRCISTPAEASP